MKIKYPTKLSEIPLGNYQKWMNTASNSTDEELMVHKLLEIFLGLKLTDVRSMKVKDINFFIDKIVKVLNTKPKFKKRWKYGNVEFGLIPDIENMSFGEYIDIESSFADHKNWHKALAVLYRPITKTFKDTYEIMEYKGDDEFHEAMKYCSLEIALGVQVFFWKLERELLLNTQSYLNDQMKKMKEDLTTAKKHNSANSGDGITASIEYVKKTYEDLMKLQPYPTIQLSPSYPMKSKKNKLSTININDN
tara:strand:+ start:3548 stop:4294 length:747 start_codon:yes stop_codon:yes gene_type:complete